MIYLDHAAATPMTARAIAAMTPYLAEQFFNPSAPYLPAKRVREAYEAAKSDLAHVIGAKGVDLIITAGATESINLAFTARGSGKALILVTEHAAVIEAAKAGNYQFINVQKSGLIDLADLRNKLSDEVTLVSVSLANNELGTIQPLAEIAEIVRAERQDRLRRGVTTPLWLHSDASQALNLMDINVARLGVDLLTINAAKCGGPKGVGALYAAHAVKLRPLTVGGGQERGLRAGTENVPGVVAFAAAAQDAKAHLANHRKQYHSMATLLRQELSRIETPACQAPKTTQTSTNQALETIKIPAQDQSIALHNSIVAQNTKKVNREASAVCESSAKPSQTTANAFGAVRFLGNSKHQLANFVPVSFPGLDAERLVYKLEQREVYVSTGAACAANKGTKSHVLAALGLSDAEIAGSLRIVLGSTNAPEQIRAAAEVIRQVVAAEYARLAHRLGAEHDVLKDGGARECPGIEARPAGRAEQAPREDGRACGAQALPSASSQGAHHA